jgi:CheY-like chemotaxis protein
MGSALPYLNSVVLADDDADHALLFGRVLDQVDPSKKLHIVRDGQELLSFLTQQVPDLLFLDLNMPARHGLECLWEIRQTLRLKDLPVVVYTSSTQMTDIQRSYLHEADLYMVKPFNSVHLRNALELILSMEWKKQYSAQKHYFINNRFVPFTA